MRHLRANRQFLHGRIGAFGAIEDLVKPSLDQSLSNLLHRPRPTRERFGDLLVSPVRPVGLSLQQNLHAEPSGWSPSVSLRPLEALPLLIRQSHYVFLLHGHFLVHTQFCRFTKNRQPKLLAFTKHELKNQPRRPIARPMIAQGSPSQRRRLASPSGTGNDASTSGIATLATNG